MHKKILLFIPIIILIISTAFTKNSTKKLDKKIFEIQEEIRVLNDCLLYTSPSPRDDR